MKRHRPRNSENRRKLQAKPLGYYMIEDHGKCISVLRYFTEEQNTEIKTMSLLAQAECHKSHQDMPGLCCVLLPSNEAQWKEWH